MGEFKIINPTGANKRKDLIRLKGSTIQIGLNIYKGTQEGTFIIYCPAIEVSGYGSTEQEAKELLDINIRVFCEDVLSMHQKERENFLASLGFQKERYHNKNFSKAFIDQNGELQNLFDEGTIERRVLESA